MNLTVENIKEARQYLASKPKTQTACHYLKQLEVRTELSRPCSTVRRLKISAPRKGGRIRMAVFAVALLLTVHFVAWGLV